MKFLRLTVSWVEVLYLSVVIITAAVAFLPREINAKAYLILLVLTLPVSIIAMVAVFMAAGLFLPVEGNVVSSVLPILVWGVLSGLQMRVLLLLVRHCRELREMRRSMRNSPY